MTNFSSQDIGHAHTSPLRGTGLVHYPGLAPNWGHHNGSVSPEETSTALPSLQVTLTIWAS